MRAAQPTTSAGCTPGLAGAAGLGSLFCVCVPCRKLQGKLKKAVMLDVFSLHKENLQASLSHLHNANLFSFYWWGRGIQVPGLTCRGQKSTMWVSGIELGSSALVENTFTHWAILSALFQSYKKKTKQNKTLLSKVYCTVGKVAEFSYKYNGKVLVIPGTSRCHTEPGYSPLRC